MFALASNAVNLMSLAEFSDIIDMEAVIWGIELFQTRVMGICGMDLLYYGGAVIQYIGTITLMIVLYRRNREGDRTRALSTMN